MIRRLVLGLVSAFAMPLLLTGATWTAVGTLEIEHTPPSASIDATQPEAPVADAAQRGDLDAVRRLLRAGADVNAGQGDGMTALHWAARNGELAMGETLLYAGANVDAGTRIGRYTPMHLAARGAHHEFVALLLQTGADPNAVTSNSGATPLHLAAASGNREVIDELVSGGAQVDKREGAWGQTPLMFAAAYNRVDAIRALLDSGADANAAANAKDVADEEEADKLAEKRLSEFLEDLKEKEGGDGTWQPSPSQVQAAIQLSREIQRKWPDVSQDDEDDDESGEEGGEEDESGDESGDETESGSEDEGAGDSAEEREGEGAPTDVAEESAPAEAEEKTGIGEDAQTGESESADASEDAEENSEDAEDDEEEEPSPLSYAQLVGGWGGLTPLLHAVRQGHTEAVLALLGGGADIGLASDGDHTQPLLMATVNGQFDLAMVLLDRGADPNAASTAGATPLFTVLERRWAPRASYAHPTDHEQQQTTHLEMLEALLEAGADPNVRLETHLWYMEYTFGVLRGSGINLQGATPFWRAAYALDIEAMRLLKDHGADPNVPTMKPAARRRRPPSPDEEETEKTEAEGSETEAGVSDEGADEEEGAEEEGAHEEGAEEEGGHEEGVHEEGVHEEGADDQESGEQAATESEQVKNPADVNAGQGDGMTAEEEMEAVETGLLLRGVGDDEDKDYSGVPEVPVNGPSIYPIHAASGVGYGQSFAGNAHRYVPDNWLAAVKFLVEEAGVEVDVRDANAFTALHHAASRGDTELVLYLVEHGADVTVLSRRGQTTADMANGPIQRVPVYPETVALLEKLGSLNNHKCVSCQ